MGRGQESKIKERKGSEGLGAAPELPPAPACSPQDCLTPMLAHG